jgi:N6-adenosine-specific RNA methylase IME4
MMYRTICADPPWEYDGAGPKARALSGRYAGTYSPHNGVDSNGRYGAMTLDALCKLQPPADDNAHLYLWTTNSFVVQAHQVAIAWGFVPKTLLTWTKTHVADPTRVSMKMGYYFRGATEHIVFAVRGSLRLNTTEGLPTGYLWPRIGTHSAKPDAFYDLVEQASPGPYLEMFARRARFGWDYWGDESLGTAAMATGDGVLR